MEEYKYLGFFSTNIFSEIQILKKWKKVRILIDSGAISMGFININYTKTQYLNLKEFDQL